MLESEGGPGLQLKIIAMATRNATASASMDHIKMFIRQH